MASFVDDPHQKEECAGGEPVVDHLHYPALEALGSEREGAQHDEAQVADRGIGDQLLQIGLHDRHYRSVDHPYHG